MNAGALVLVPSRIEAEELLGQPLAGSKPQEVRLGQTSYRLALCGVGLVSAAVQATRWLHQLQPQSIVLVGSAGSYDLDAAPVGTLLAGTSVACEGIGVGEGEEFHNLPLSLLATGLRTQQQELGLPLELPDLPEELHSSMLPGMILSVTSSAGSPGEVCRRLGRHPDALVEEMEGFAVALAGQEQGVPVTILRGVSNRAGNRNHRQWNIPAAMAACRKALQKLPAAAVPPS
jgi:futalosine hydrolase